MRAKVNEISNSSENKQRSKQDYTIGRKRRKTMDKTQKAFVVNSKNILCEDELLRGKGRDRRKSDSGVLKSYSSCKKSTQKDHKNENIDQIILKEALVLKGDLSRKRGAVVKDKCEQIEKLTTELNKRKEYLCEKNKAKECVPSDLDNLSNERNDRVSGDALVKKERYNLTENTEENATKSNIQSVVKTHDEMIEILSDDEFLEEKKCKNGSLTENEKRNRSRKERKKRLDKNVNWKYFAGAILSSNTMKVGMQFIKIYSKVSNQSNFS